VLLYRQVEELPADIAEQLAQRCGARESSVVGGGERDPSRPG
jgi:hypothetical protein